MEQIYDLIIIGSGATGLSAGIYAGRAKLNTLVLEKDRQGGQAITTDEIVNYPGIRRISGPKLMEDMKLQAMDFGVKLLSAEVRDMDFSEDIKILRTSAGTLKAYSVLIATGASPRKLGFPGESEFTGRGVAYCSTCDGEFFKGLDVFVVGAGFAAAEEAIFLTRFAKKVTVIAREPEFTCAKTIADKVLAHPKIEVKFNTEVVEATGSDVLNAIKFVNNQTGETSEYHASEADGTFGIFIFVGYAPASDIFTNHVTVNADGYIPTSDLMETNVPGVFAAGDLRPKVLRQIVTAVSDGAIAAVTAEKYVTELKERLGIEDAYEPEETTSAAPSSAEPTPSVHQSSPSTSFLTDEIKSQLQGILTRLDQDVTLASIMDYSNESCLEIEAFLKDLKTLSPRLHLEIYNKGENPEFEAHIHADKLPVISFLDAKGNYTGIKFHGVPGGHELNSFILALYNLAGPGQALDSSITERITNLTTPTQMKVAVSLACHFCPDVVTAAQRIAMLNPAIEAEMIDLALFPELKEQFRVMSVPAIIFNDKNVIFGAKKIDEIVSILEK